MDGYHTNQDGQWKTSDQWRAEEANTSPCAMTALMYPHILP